jgi:glycosyltransferase involved in cell wall biosynthesis
MRVAISLLTLVPGRVGGSETYARELLRALSRTPDLDARAFVPEIARDAGSGLPTTVVPEYRTGGSESARVLSLVTAAAFPRRLRRRFRGFDVVHYPLTVPVPTVPEAARVLTLHDVQHRDQPAYFSRATRIYRALAYDRAARKADLVVVPSEFVRSRAIELLGLPPEKVRVVAEGVDQDAFAPGDEPREEFLLYPARPWPHKNHQRLFEGFAALRRIRDSLRLVLVGGGLDELRPLPDGVEARGLVAHADLVDLYRRAACLVFPSLYEGFGLPPLEAMACGCPVAASNAASLPEVCGEAAVLFDATDPQAIAAGILEAIERSEELRVAGFERAAAFTWDAAARGHVEAYESVA